VLWLVQLSLADLVIMMSVWICGPVNIFMTLPPDQDRNSVYPRFHLGNLMISVLLCHMPNSFLGNEVIQNS